MKKIILILLTVFLFVFANSVFAADLSVVCSESSCNTSPAGAPLFNEVGFAPGQSITRTIYVQNNNSNDDCSLDLTVKNPKDESNLAGVLATAINDGSTNLFSDLFSQLFPTKTINMGVIPKSGSKTFDWLVTFNPAADNSYQNSQTKFDFDLNFSCGNAPGTSNSTTSGCSDSKPGSAPKITSAVAGANSVTLFWDKASDPVTYYLVTYGTSPGAQTYGNPNVGNATSYTVNGLSGGTTYYFKVRAGNGCMPGDYSNEVSATPTGGFIAGPAAGFEEGVLGTQENLNSGVSTQAGEVKGAKSEPWWLLLFLIFPFLWLLRIILSKMVGNESS